MAHPKKKHMKDMKHEALKEPEAHKSKHMPKKEMPKKHMARGR